VVKNIIRLLLIMESVSLAIGSWTMCHPFESTSYAIGNITIETLLFCMYATFISIGNLLILIEIKKSLYDILISFLQVIVLASPFLYSYFYEDPNSIVGIIFLYVVMHASLMSFVSEMSIFVLYPVFVVLHLILFIACVWRKLSKLRCKTLGN